MGDVEGAAGQPLRGRPLQSMPCQVEQDARNSPIDQGCALELGRLDQTVLPGARKQCQLERTCAVVCKSGQQGVRELMRILAHAGALAQRRTVIKEVARLLKSFRVSILL